jgi:hypothetical protein
MASALAAMTLGGVLLAAAVDHVPTLDTAATCAAAGELSMNESVATCRRSEREARDALAAQWAQFPASGRRECVETTNIGGFPSYVQVLTCLELARDARHLPAD